jgi:hypothetical protein
LERVVATAVLVASLLGCKAYDSQLLGEEPLPLQTPPPEPPAAAEFVCGDGVVADTEKCDVGILADLPGGCPATCPAVSGCANSVLVGAACETQCVVEPLPCAGGDTCCPAGCDNDSDSDCSTTCGNGRVDTDQGESCEVDDPMLPCPGDCDDDDPCTMDVLEGSPDNCNVTCSHLAVTILDPGDECCPAGANANMDADCTVECGNGIREADEECDGSESCDGDCNLMVTDELTRCIDTYGTDPCLECTCMNCQNLVFDCFESGDADKDGWCADVVACGRANTCAGEGRRARNSAEAGTKDAGVGVGARKRIRPSLWIA